MSSTLNQFNIGIISPGGWCGDEDILSDFFERPVDLLTEGGLSPFMRDDVLASALDLFHDIAA